MQGRPWYPESVNCGANHAAGLPENSPDVIPFHMIERNIAVGFGAHEKLALSQFWCNSWGRASIGGNRGRIGQDPSAKQLETGAPIHLTLDRLEAIYLALHLSIAPWGVHGGSHRRDVFLQPVGEPDDLAEFRPLGVLYPLADLSGIICFEDVAEIESEFPQGR